MKHFVKDDFWDCITGAETLESFTEKILPQFWFTKEVPEEVLKSFGIVRRILEHSYISYDLLDPALTKLLLSFEMALRIRYKEINQKDWKGDLKPLMLWFNQEGYFEFDCQPLLDAIRGARNDQAHPKTHFGGGLGILGIFELCNSLINDLYEDRTLRKQRNEKELEINHHLEYIDEKGATITTGTKKEIIYMCQIYFVNNGDRPIICYGYYKSLFEVFSENGQTKLSEPFLHYFEFNDFDVLPDGSILIKENGKLLLIINKITEQTDQDEFNKWKLAFAQKRDYWHIHSLAISEIDSYWHILKNNFHFHDKSFV